MLTAFLSQTLFLALYALIVNHMMKLLNIFFWYCNRWRSFRTPYSALMRLFSLVGTQWPNCPSPCGWIERGLQYGFPFLEHVGLFYSVTTLVHDVHHMYLNILLARHAASQVLRSTPLTPCHHPHSPLTPQSVPCSPSSCVQLPRDVSPMSLFSSPG